MQKIRYTSTMKTRTIRMSVAAIFACLTVFAFAAPASAGVDDFYFNSFDADYTLTRDAQDIGRLHVVEHLVAVFPDTDQNHGILRAIPKTYQSHSVHLKVASVTDSSGAGIPYTKSTSNQNLVL